MARSGRQLFLGIAVGALAIASIAMPAAAADLGFRGAPAASGGTSVVPWSMIANLMPGDTVDPLTITIEASASATYRVQPHIDGSDALARAVRARMTTDGVLVFDGALTDALAAGNVAATGITVLEIQLSLPVSTGNDVLGATVSVNWVATTADPEAR